MFYLGESEASNTDSWVLNGIGAMSVIRVTTLTKEERQSIFSVRWLFTRTSTNLYVGASRLTS